MNKQQLKKRAKRFFIAALIIGALMFIVAAVHWLFFIPSVVFFYIAFLVFKDIRELNEEEDDVQEVVHSNLEEKQIKQYGGINMETTNEEKAELLDTLSKDEDVNLFLKVTKGQVKFGLFEKLRTDLEAKPEKKETKQDKGKAEKGGKEEEDIVVED